MHDDDSINCRAVPARFDMPAGRPAADATLAQERTVLDHAQRALIAGLQPDTRTVARSRVGRWCAEPEVPASIESAGRWMDEASSTLRTVA
ncbi:MAG: hypothetical protein BFD77_19560 [Pseudomonas sp. CO183]|nr:MAG: hypothetical protein BFD77_19560 [Pseudomonas sp. CO183]